MYSVLSYLDPLRHAGSAASVDLTHLAEVPTMNAPSAPPPIISSSTGCSNAPRCPPASAKPPNTAASTITYPRITSIAAPVHVGLQCGSLRANPAAAASESSVPQATDCRH